MRNRLVAASIVLAGLAASACSTLTVSSGTGRSTEEGIIGNRVADTDFSPLVVQSRGLGVFSRGDGVTVGWLNETRVYISTANAKCQTVILTNRVDDVKNVIAALEKADSSLAGICVLKQETD